jgi:hypothetical protein
MIRFRKFHRFLKRTPHLVIKAKAEVIQIFVAVNAFNIHNYFLISQIDAKIVFSLSNFYVFKS